MEKVHRKQRRKEAQYLREERDTDITFQEERSAHVFIGNGGLRNGVPRELLEHLLNSSSQPSTLTPRNVFEQLYLPSGKHYAFVTFNNATVAARTVSILNGVCIKDHCYKDETLLSYLTPTILNGPPIHLYLSFVDKIPLVIQVGFRGAIADDLDTNHPPGLILSQDFISAEEETELMKKFKISPDVDTLSPKHAHLKTLVDPAPNDSGMELSDKSSTETSPWFHCDQLKVLEPSDTDILTQTNISPAVAEVNESTDHHPHATLKHRCVMHYGYEFLYGVNTVDPNDPLPGGLPVICTPLLDRMVKRGIVSADYQPDQLTVNEYFPGAGIPSHVDTHSAFEGPILSLSLGSQVIMEFKHPCGRKVPVFLAGRSLLSMTGEARYLWSHGIPSRHHDEVYPSLLGYSPSPVLPALNRNGSSVLHRSVRISLTFRKIRKDASVCVCDYPAQCDNKVILGKPCCT